MADNNPFGLKCVSNGAQLYVNSTSSAYLGCCVSDPRITDDALCPQSDIRAMTFDKAMYNNIEPQQCAKGKSSWYTCALTTPPFIGCCTTNPCLNGGCPSSNLGSATLSSNPKDAASFMEGAGKSAAPASSSTATTTTTKPTESSAAPTASPTPSSSAPAAGDSGGGNNSSHPGVTAGIAVGAAVGVAAVVLGVLWWMRRRRAKAKQNGAAGSDAPFSPATQCATPSTPAWSAGQSHMVSDYQKCPTGPGSPVPPDYYSVATGGKLPVEATELPANNVCFELAADDGPAPPPKKQ
ncbi:hypothetical protein A9K55_009052 [Cordyceps militaris]|uniref:Uncharacterized protein n=1 Tax=Cordyceps militaris TaxID=73501 RepID=A0A2H4SHV3_CORMI|nr:hypothetical protein A9K55_009052 [Cordyceps militaris]